MRNASFKLALYGCVDSVWCVGISSFDVVCDELHDCAWNVGLYQLSNYCVYIYGVESFAHIDCYSDCLRRRSHLVEPIYFNVGSTVTVECCGWYPC